VSAGCNFETCSLSGPASLSYRLMVATLGRWGVTVARLWRDCGGPRVMNGPAGRGTVCGRRVHALCTVHCADGRFSEFSKQTTRGRHALWEELQSSAIRRDSLWRLKWGRI